ncbi:MAG: sulfatase-like hydrolase/transferase, partial [Burkholderiales bacterium]|nr:sulfatase-like hydrolase/transferase [Burkholderiales bacterium]
MHPGNLLIILSDEHNIAAMGCAGHPDVLTPNLDAMAARGTRFANASCASPICVPARAALATGRNVHETGYWDNVDAYDGRTPSWHHALRSAGHEVVSIGKLHYRGWDGDDYGFSESLLPMHIHAGRGEVKMLLRNPPASVGDGSNLLRSARAGESDYTRYDERITDRAIEWIAEHGKREAGAKPWVLMVSLVAPHFPLTVPQRFFDLYRDKKLRMPKGYAFGVDEDAHPFVRQYARESGYNLHFESQADVQRALCGYYGLVSCLDDKVGRLLEALADAGLEQSTRVMYLSDHGDNAGARGLWGKSTMYAESVGVPLILQGPEVARGRVEQACVSHIDVYDTVLDAVGVPASKSSASPRS